jgi:hypothetical protein
MATTLLDHHDVRSQIDLLAAWIESQRAYRGWQARRRARACWRPSCSSLPHAI